MPFQRPSASWLATIILLTAWLSGCDEEVLFIEPSIAASETSVFVEIDEVVGIDVVTVPGDAQLDVYSDDPATATVAGQGRNLQITGVEIGFATVVLSLPEHPGTQLLITVEVVCPAGEECVLT